MKIKVIVTLKNGVLDPQGKAIQQTLNGMSFLNIEEVFFFILVLQIALLFLFFDMICNYIHKNEIFKI